ncbi:hypothetical protein GCM10007978_43550 [Shewanella hanedai]|uniref:Transposase n=1 Tax=Shewanella hanedai TaxID=25 RepID=A0A553JHW1_SHEHA|nr:transposase [Shewanella hanedai]TRY12032.1 transposase [Shewanella hanedai]GGJ01185.1 hypothetical protein GCM10007978_43550 [Shewanella hanedai]
MANYKPDLSCQSKFIPINFAEQVLPGTFEYALSYIVEHKLDLTPFDKWYHNDTSGANAAVPSVTSTKMFPTCSGISSTDP